MMKDSFANYHPFNNFLYFTLVIGFSLAVNHPLAQIIALFCACAYAISIRGKSSVLFILKYCIPTVLITAFINSAFNHRGMTVLFYLSNGNSFTLESILYGISAGVMLVTVLLWFNSFNRVMTSDKFIYLFGKIIPALSLVLSMALRFVPRFKEQMTAVTEAQRSIGRDVSKGNLWQRMKTAMLIFSIMISWSLENAIETADSMKSRGYGLKGRTSFSLYKFEDRDKVMTVWLVLCGLLLTIGEILSAFGFEYFPFIRYASLDLTTIPFYLVFFALCITPVAINIKEERKWKTLYSKM